MLSCCAEASPGAAATAAAAGDVRSTRARSGPYYGRRQQRLVSADRVEVDKVSDGRARDGCADDDDAAEAGGERPRAEPGDGLAIGDFLGGRRPRPALPRPPLLGRRLLGHPATFDSKAAEVRPLEVAAEVRLPAAGDAPAPRRRRLVLPTHLAGQEFSRGPSGRSRTRTQPSPPPELPPRARRARPPRRSRPPPPPPPPPPSRASAASCRRRYPCTQPPRASPQSPGQPARTLVDPPPPPPPPWRAATAAADDDAAADDAAAARRGGGGGRGAAAAAAAAAERRASIDRGRRRGRRRSGQRAVQRPGRGARRSAHALPPQLRDLIGAQRRREHHDRLRVDHASASAASRTQTTALPAALLRLSREWRAAAGERRRRRDADADAAPEAEARASAVVDVAERVDVGSGRSVCQ